MTVKQQFQDHLHHYGQLHGWDLPLLLEDYLAALLADRLTAVDIIPEPSWAESWLRLQQQPRAEPLRIFGDQCLFFASLMPRYWQRRSVSDRYCHSLGSQAYELSARLGRDPRCYQLSQWFDYLQQFLCSALNRDPLVQSQMDQWFDRLVSQECGSTR